MAVGVLVHLLSCLVVRYQILLTYLQRKYNGIMLAKLHNFLLFLMQSNLEHITFHCLKVRIIQKVSFEVTCPKNECQFVHKMELFKYVHSQSQVHWYFFVHVLENSHYERYVLKLSDLYRSVNWVAKSDPEYL